MAISYQQAGVDVEAGNELVGRLKSLLTTQMEPGLLSGHGGFVALCRVPGNYDQPVMALGTDGVGTKLELLIEHDHLHTAGQDLVAMCANDVLVYGAAPHMFLDYLATGRLNVEEAELVIKSIAGACELAGCTLAGGETAEMPGFYPEGKFDLAGFCVGWVEEANLLLPQNVQVGDVVLGLASSGPHSNGYSLIRKLLANAKTPPGSDLIRSLLEPTRIYVKSLLPFTDHIHAMAHITGGGFADNLPRAYSDDLAAHLQLDAWHRPEVFKWIQSEANIGDLEMLSTFNCGIGMILILPPGNVDGVRKGLKQLGETTYVIGQMHAVSDAASHNTLVVARERFELV